MSTPLAYVGGIVATDLAEVATDPAVLDTAGFWVVVVTFEGQVTCARFRDVKPGPLPRSRLWVGPDPGGWRSTLDRTAYTAAVEEIRTRIAAGEVYQVNLCRELVAPLPSYEPDLLPLAHVLAAGNPAPYAALVRLPDHGIHVASASPELYLRRDGRKVASSPIKGTGQTPADLLPKDVAENVMIVDLVRNDLGRVCEVGSIHVSDLLALEEHPGLVHLVSTVTGRLPPGVGWADLLAASFPPGSVSGAPKSTALKVISELEPTPRGPYCGAIGWVDADRGAGALAVGIRTFWASEGHLRFGTGAGITWGSEPEREWAETELKAARLVGLACRTAKSPAVALQGDA